MKQKRICKKCNKKLTINRFTHKYAIGKKYYSYECKGCRSKGRRKPPERPFVLQDGEILSDWKEYKGRYKISNYGRVCSLMHASGHGSFKRDVPIILVPNINTNGRPAVTIRISNGFKTHTIHRVVAKHFVKNPLKYNVVMHIDDNKLNNHFTNLKWGTNSQNTRDAYLHGLIKPARGSARNKSTLTEKDIVNILKSKESSRKIAVKYGVGHCCISDIRSGKSWNHITGLLCTRKIRPKYSKDIQFI